MSELLERFQGLSAAWKAFVISFAVLVVLSALGGYLVAAPFWALLNALIWAAAVGGIVRLYTRMRDWPPR